MSKRTIALLMLLVMAMAMGIYITAIPIYAEEDNNNPEMQAVKKAMKETKQKRMFVWYQEFVIIKQSSKPGFLRAGSVLSLPMGSIVALNCLGYVSLIAFPECQNKCDLITKEVIVNSRDELGLLGDLCMLEVMSTTHILNNILRFQRNQTN